MDQLQRYIGQNTTLASSIDQCAHPLDALYKINPEIASLAYANKEQWLTPEVLPAIGLFRKMQRDEKIATIAAIVNALGIESEERKYELLMHTNLDIERMGNETERRSIDSEEKKHERSMSTLEQITELQEAGSTERTGMITNTALEIQKLKYETDVKIVEQNMTGQRYLSDNELKATYIEAQALGDIIAFTEQTQAETQRRAIDAKLKERIIEAECEYLARIKEAESLRQIECHRDNSKTIQHYIDAQAEIMHAAITGEIQRDNNTAAIVQTYLTEQSKIIQAERRTHEQMTKECADLLKSKDCRKVKISIRGKEYFSMEVRKNDK